ncbi:MAG: TolC family protein [Lentisphaerota bacterium]
MIVILVGGGLVSQGQETLSLSNAIEKALKFNLGLAIDRQSPIQAREDLEISRAGFDPVLQVSGSAQESRQAAAASELDGSETPVSRGQDGQVSVSKKFSSGANVSLDGQADRSDTDSSYAKLNPAFSTDAGVAIQQPLLKGGGRDVNLLGVRLGEIAVSKADLGLRSKVLNLLRDVEKAYWDAAYALASQDVCVAAKKQAADLVKETEARNKAGLATTLDVVQAQAEEAAKQESVINADQTVLNTSDRLLILLGRLNEHDRSPAISGDLASAPVPPAEPLEQALAAARNNQPDYLSQAESIRARRYELDAARRNQWPSLDLSGRASYAGQSDTLNSAADSMLARDGYRWQIGLEYKSPWGFREERARLQKSYLGLAQEHLRMDQLDQDLILQMRTAYRALSTAQESLVAAGLTRDLRGRQAAMERARYSAGTATLRDTLTAQNEFESARLRELKARLDHIAAVLELGRMEGSLLARHGLNWAKIE